MSTACSTQREIDDKKSVQRYEERICMTFTSAWIPYCARLPGT